MGSIFGPFFGLFREALIGALEKRTPWKPPTAFLLEILFDIFLIIGRTSAADDRQSMVGTENEERIAYFNAYYHVAGLTTHGKLSGFGWYPSSAVEAVSMDSIVQVSGSERFLFTG